MDAYDEMMTSLKKNEWVEAVVLGKWGGIGPGDDVYKIPKRLMGRVLTREEAEPYMRGWSFEGGYGCAECPAVYVWTNMRVMYVAEYDGSTTLASVPRYPCVGLPGFSS